MRMDDLARPAIEVVERDEVRIVPENYKRVYLDWMRNIRPWCISRQLWWGHRIPVWYCDACGETYAAESPPARCGACDGELRQEQDVLDTWFSSALWPFAALGWPEETPELAAFYPTMFLTTAREIIFLWVARMVMMGIEFAGDIPFHDVYVHPVIQASDGRRMSKSLGTGIDPIDEISTHGADGVRFGLLAMSSTQDVRYSAERIQQGQDLANKMWNASRLVLLNAAPANARQERAPAGVAGGTGFRQERPSLQRVEDLWIVSRLQRAIEGATASIDSYDFAHAALGLYDYFWSELCDWYLEIVKPRLYDGDPRRVGHLALGARADARADPPGDAVRDRGDLLLSARRAGRRHGGDAGHPSVPRGGPEAGRRGAPSARSRHGSTSRARSAAGATSSGSQRRASCRRACPATNAPHELVGRLARLSFDGAEGEILATFGPVEILPSEDVDADQVRRRIAERRDTLQFEVERAEGKLANTRFVDKAPADVVEAERAKLARYQAELEELP